MSETTSLIAGTVVLFNPEPDVAQNIKSYLSHLSLLVVVDNSTIPCLAIAETLKKNDSVLFISNASNMGIAAALNQGAREASLRGYHWLLTMDQDSYFEPPAIASFLEGPKEYPSAAILSPFPRLQGKEACRKEKEWEEVPYAITSGSLVNLGIYNELGGFDERLFIDYVDYDFCFRVRKRGYKIIRLNRIDLHHSLGMIVEKRLLLWRFHPTNHSSVRKYYITRNRLLVLTKYQQMVLPELFAWVKEIVKMFLFEKDRFQKIRYMALGLYHYITGKYGPLD